MTDCSSSVTIFEADMCTKKEMFIAVCEVFEPLLLLSSADSNFSSALYIWERIVRNKQGPGLYCLPFPNLQIPIYFPHAVTNEEDVLLLLDKNKSNIYQQVFSLEENDISPTQTSDPSKIAWHTGQLALTISPPLWDLKQELAELGDPDVPVHVKISLSNLEFKSFADVKKLHEYNKNTGLKSQYILIFSGSRASEVIKQPSSQEEEKEDEHLGCLIRYSIDRIARFSHCTVTENTSERIWYDLITSSRVGKNMFSMQMPFLVRMVTEGYDFSKTPRNSVMVVNKYGSTLQQIPLDYDTDTRIGLFSMRLEMILTKDSLPRVPLIRTELWPDISSSLSDLSAPPVGCKVDIYFSDIKFVSFSNDHEKTLMKEEYKENINIGATDITSIMINWFKWLGKHR